MKLRAGEKVFVCGQRSSGKTTWMQHAAQTAAGVCVFDPEHEWGPFGEPVHTVEAMLEAAQDGEQRVVYQPMGLGEEAKTECDAWARATRALQGWVLIVDETAIAFNESDPPPAVQREFRTCHKRDNSLWMGTHRLKDVPPVLRMVDAVVAFEAHVELFLNDLAEVHPDAPRVVPALAEYEWAEIRSGQPITVYPPLPI